MPAVRPLRIKTYLHPDPSKISLENTLLDRSRGDPAPFEIGFGNYFGGSGVNLVKYPFNLSLTVQQDGAVIITPLLLCYNWARNITILLSGNFPQHTGDRPGGSFILCHLLQCF